MSDLLQRALALLSRSLWNEQGHCRFCDCSGGIERHTGTCAYRRLLMAVEKETKESVNKAFSDYSATPKRVFKVRVRIMPGDVWKWSVRFGETQSLSPDTYFVTEELAVENARRVAKELGMDCVIEGENNGTNS